MSNTSKNDSKIDDDDEIHTKYQPPKVVPLKEILNQDSEDASLNKYKEKLIGTAVNVIIGKFIDLYKLINFKINLKEKVLF